MREIKFRVFVKDSKFGSKIIAENMTVMDFIEDAQESSELPMELKMNECVWMQYTGLKDKNGKDIYEGDILYVEFEKSRTLNHFDIYLKKIYHVAKWYGQGFNIPNIEGEFRQTLCTAIHNKNKPTPEWEVIGNIYENPELLKEEK